MGQNLIVGNGLIASSFSNVDFGRPALVLASGVSDSMETSDLAFQREADLIEQSIRLYPKKHVVYFSTCSVESGIETPYIEHKLTMENLVLANAPNSHIFRLPQVVGQVRNRTLVSFLVDSILQGRVLKVQTQATRNLLCVRDLARVATLAIRKNAGEGVPQNIASSIQVPVSHIVDEISRLLCCKTRIEMVEAGYSQVIDTTFLHRLLSSEDPLFDPGYWRRVLHFYVPLIASSYDDVGKAH